MDSKLEIVDEQLTDTEIKILDGVVHRFVDESLNDTLTRGRTVMIDGPLATDKRAATADSLAISCCEKAKADKVIVRKKVSDSCSLPAILGATILQQSMVSSDSWRQRREIVLSQIKTCELKPEVKKVKTRNKSFKKGK